MYNSEQIQMQTCLSPGFSHRPEYGGQPGEPVSRDTQSTIRVFILCHQTTSQHEYYLMETILQILGVSRRRKNCLAASISIDYFFKHLSFCFFASICSLQSICWQQVLLRKKEDDQGWRGKLWQESPLCISHQPLPPTKALANPRNQATFPIHSCWYSLV